jgi:hypothetical protein
MSFIEHAQRSVSSPKVSDDVLNMLGKPDFLTNIMVKQKQRRKEEKKRLILCHHLLAKKNDICFNPIFPAAENVNGTSS